MTFLKESYVHFTENIKFMMIWYGKFPWSDSERFYMTISFLLRVPYTELILSLPPANEGRRYFVMTSLIGWAQA